MNRKYFLGMVLGFLSLSGISQSVVDSSFFYYYQGKKQYIELNTQQAFVSSQVSAFSNKEISLLQCGIVQVRDGIYDNCLLLLR